MIETAMGFLTNNMAPVSGGILIGLAATLLLWGNGRIAGISGIVWQAIRDIASTSSPAYWRLVFVIGLVLGPLLLMAISDHSIPVSNPSGWPVLIIAGFLVGFGTRLGSGCTSGHGICGMARLSPRSIWATAVFMAAGVLTVSLVRHVMVL